MKIDAVLTNRSVVSDHESERESTTSSSANTHSNKNHHNKSNKNSHQLIDHNLLGAFNKAFKSGKLPHRAPRRTKYYKTR